MSIRYMYTYHPWHYISPFFAAAISGPDLTDGRRQTHADSLEDFAAGPLALTPYGYPFAIFYDHGLLKGFEILFDVRPFEVMPGGVQPAVELLFENQGQKAAEHMAANRVIPLMIDRPCFKNRSGVSKDLLYLPELLVFECHVVDSKLGVRGEHPLAVKDGLPLIFSWSMENAPLSVLR